MSTGAAIVELLLIALPGLVLALLHWERR